MLLAPSPSPIPRGDFDDDSFARTYAFDGVCRCAAVAHCRAADFPELRERASRSVRDAVSRLMLRLSRRVPRGRRARHAARRASPLRAWRLDRRAHEEHRRRRCRGTGMPAWSQTLDATQIRRLAIYISEQRASFGYTDFKIGTPLDSRRAFSRARSTTSASRPSRRISTPCRISIAPLPDGRILLSEKTRGLSIISADGNAIRADSRHAGRLRRRLRSARHPARRSAWAGCWTSRCTRTTRENGWIYLQLRRALHATATRRAAPRGARSR